MANIHRLNDLNNNPPQRGRLRQPMLNGLAQISPSLQQHIANDKIPFMRTMVSQRAPLDETVPYTLKIVWCPNFTFLSITTFWLLTIWGLYIFCCTQGINNSVGVLRINSNVLEKYGGLTKYSIQNGQIWRLITAAFLHIDLLHISMNSLSLSFLFTRVQKIYNPLLMLLFILVSAIGGNILSVNIMDTNVISVGSSSIIFGVMGLLLGYMTMNWTCLGYLRSQLCCMIGFIIFFGVIFSFSSGVDAGAHFGGLIAGYLFTLAVLPAIEEKDKRITIVGIVLLLAYFLTTFLVFFL